MPWFCSCYIKRIYKLSESFEALVLLEDLKVQRLRSTVVSVSSAISATAMLDTDESK